MADREVWPESATGERLQKVMARAGLASRRACEEMIAAGRVAVNGIPAPLGARVGPEDRITVDRVPVVTDTTLVYYLLHKPTKVVTTADDPQGRPTVVELVPGEPRVFPVGRLDYDTSGLLILTNDGELTNLLTHPRHGVDKTYSAEVVGEFTEAELKRLRTGIELDDGMTSPAKCRVTARGDGVSLLEITIHEGRNRQVRRMCEAVGHEVLQLSRSRIASLRDPNLRAGQWRWLGVSEVRDLYASAMSHPSDAPRPR